MTLLTLVNTNRMLPPIAPIGLDYVASAVRQAAGGEVELVDLCLAEDTETELDRYFAARQPALVGFDVSQRRRLLLAQRPVIHADAAGGCGRCAAQD
jgi:hypothetical protein